MTALRSIAPEPSEPRSTPGTEVTSTVGNETPAAPSPAAVGMRPAERGVGDGFDGPAGDPKRLPGPALVLVWAPRHKGTRSGWLARALGIGDPVYVAPTLGRGLRAAPLKYPRQLVATLALLAGRRPRVVLVQSPPSFATWVVAAYAAATGAAFVVDAHSDAFERPIWTRPRFLVRLVARRAAATIVTNAHWARLVESWGGRALTVPSVPARFEPGPPPPLGPGFDVAVVNTWARDEPIEAVLAAAEELPEVTFHVTGRTEPVARLGRPVPPNVRFVGFLPEPTYYGLLAGARAVMCLTTRDHTMQNGACEALALGVPIVTSDWPVLRTYFDRGTVHVDNTPAGIVAGIRRLIDRYDELRAEIVALRDAREREWAATRAALVDMVLARLGGAGETRR